MTAANAQRPDPRKNPREQQGKDSCMTVAAPVLVGIGLLLSKLRPRPVSGERADAGRVRDSAAGDGGAPGFAPVSGRASSPP